MEEPNLLQKIKEGAEEKFGKTNPEIDSRLNEEWQFIKESNNTEYVHLIAKFTEFCNGRNVLRTPGRVPELNFLLYYCLDITKINPLEYGFVFKGKSFDNQEFSDTEINIEEDGPYLLRLFSESLTDLQLGYLVQPLTDRPFLRDELIGYKGKVYEILLPTVLIARPTDWQQTTHFTVKGINYYVVKDRKKWSLPTGFHRFYLLESRFLTRLNEVYELSNKQIHPYNVPLNDNDAFGVLQRAETDGITEFESEGIRKYLLKFQPESMEELAVLNGLYHPVEMDKIPKLIELKRKYGSDGVKNSQYFIVKPHFLSTSIVGYWGAYYKAHYPNEFQEIFKFDEHSLI